MPLMLKHLSALATLWLAIAAGRAEAAFYYQTNLVANKASYNPTYGVDENLVNPWGISLRPPGAGGHIWISNAGNLSTSLYIGDVHGVPLHQDGLKLVY